MKLSSSAGRKGEQRPRLNVAVGNVAYNEAEDVIELSVEMGMVPMLWQENILREWCARDASGNPSYVTCGLDVPRQNGKNAILECYELFALTACGWHILHTAHRVKTAKKSFQRLARYFEDDEHPELKALVEKIRRTNGEEGIYLKSGASIEFIARTNGTARGFDDIQLVIFDEAQELTDAQFDAIMYTLAASATGERQIIYTGTPPNEKSPGTVFARTRKSILKGDVRRSNWNSWAVEDCPPENATFKDVLDLVYQSNPSMGYLLDEEFTESEFAGGSVEGFAHERLDWWSPTGTTDTAIDEEAWMQLKVPRAPTDDEISKICCAAKFAPDGSRGTISIAVKQKDGPVYVEVVESRNLNSGSGWVAEWINDRKKRLAVAVIDGRVGAPAVVEKLNAMKFPKRAIKCPSSAQVASACSMIVDAVKSGNVCHYGQPALNDAMTKCAKRPIGGDGFGFADTVEGDSTMAESVALAYQEVLTTKRKPGRGCVML